MITGVSIVGGLAFISIVYLSDVCNAHATITNSVHYLDQIKCGIRQHKGPRGWWMPWIKPTCKFDIKCNPREIYRRFNGTCNNPVYPQWGCSQWPQDRLLPAEYQDGYWYPRTLGVRRKRLPSARLVSQAIHTADSDFTKQQRVSNLYQVWGQFLDHDITLTPMSKASDGTTLKCCSDSQNKYGPGRYKGGNCFSISIPPWDKNMKRRCMSLSRSQTSPKARTCKKPHLEQLNGLTAFVDASMVYSPDDTQAAALRAFRGGLLKTAGYNMMPKTDDNTTCLKLEPVDFCYLAGDKRVNEHPGLSVFHVIFLREHNRIATILSGINPHWNDEIIFQETRKIIIAQTQIITYWHWLTITLGPKLMKFFELDLSIPFKYRPETNPTIFNAFATAAFRYGHSQIPNIWAYGKKQLPLQSMFLRPHILNRDEGYGVKDMVSGMLTDNAQTTDALFSDGIANHMFETKTRPPMDLPALNIQRGRDHGIPPYWKYRQFCKKIFRTNPRWPKGLISRMYKTYGSLKDVDLFTGGVSELPVRDGQVGPTFACLLGLQFHRIKWGDRFWHQTSDQRIGFNKRQYKEIRKTSLAKILCVNAGLTEVQANPFYTPSSRNKKVKCADLPTIDLSAWDAN